MPVARPISLLGPSFHHTGTMSQELMIILAVVGVLLIAGIAFFLVRSRGRSGGAASPDVSVGSAAPAAAPDAGPVDAPGAAPATATAVPTLERPEVSGTRWQRLRTRLATAGSAGNAVLAVFSRGKLAEEDWEEIEETLLMADLGLEPATRLLETLRREAKVLDTSDPNVVRELLRRELLQLVDPALDRTLNLAPVLSDDGSQHPATILMVGVNGTGKTTTVGKLARLLVADGHIVLLGAADTFRAAAAEQLATWGSRVGVSVVRAEREGADPASVAFETVREGIATGADVVIVDTAGRLQTKTDLMDELGKIKRVMSRGAPVREVLLVIDATTGQNGLRQAQVFSEAVDITGIVLTKLDGTAKGGIVVAVQQTLGVPVKLVGLGEGPDDLAPFDPAGFVDALLS